MKSHNQTPNPHSAAMPVQAGAAGKILNSPDYKLILSIGNKAAKIYGRLMPPPRMLPLGIR